MNKDQFDISIEEFDAPGETHEFSERYKKTRDRNKQKYLYSRPQWQRIASIAAAAALFIATPFVVNAATDGELFERIWGILGKKDVEAHQELVYEAEKDSSYYIAYPARDYAELDPETAKALIGDCVQELSLSQEVDGTTITLLSAVRDNNSAVVALTLEKEGGVDILNYSRLDNEAKGAWFSEKSTFVFNIGYGGNLYVDLDKSTDDKLYCYDYVPLNTFGTGSLRMEIEQYPCTLGERDALLAEEYGSEQAQAVENGKKTTELRIPCEKRLGSTAFTNAGGGQIEMSPISMNIDMNTGLGLTPGQAYDPYSAYKIVITYRDGSTYTVLEHEYPDVYACDEYIDNTSYSCGSLDNEFLLIFNRLVDPEDVVSVTVNGIEYTR